MRTIFMGSCPFALQILQALVQDQDPFLEVIAVFTAPPQPKGRGHHLQETCVHQYAETQGFPVLTPTSLRKSDVLEAFRALEPEIVIVASYGFIIPPAFLEVPKAGFINVHPSLLPRWRGACPVPAAILAGDLLTGISIMKMDAGMDTGPLLTQQVYPINAGDTGASLMNYLAHQAGPILLNSLRHYLHQGLVPQSQSVEGVTYTQKLTRQAGQLCWDTEAAILERKVRAFTPWPGAWFMAGAKRIQVLAADVRPGPGGLPVGSVVPSGSGIGIVCQEGALLCPLRIKPEGGREMPIEAFLCGHQLPSLL